MATDHGGGHVTFDAPGEAVPEGGTFPYVVNLYDEAGAALPAANVSTVTGTVRAPRSGTVPSGWSARNLKNVGGGTLVDGKLTVVVSGTPMAVIAGEEGLTFFERQLTLVIAATGAGGASLPVVREVTFFVRNLAGQP